MAMVLTSKTQAMLAPAIDVLVAAHLIFVPGLVFRRALVGHVTSNRTVDRAIDCLMVVVLARALALAMNVKTQLQPACVPQSPVAAPLSTTTACILHRHSCSLWTATLPFVVEGHVRIQRGAPHRARVGEEA